MLLRWQRLRAIFIKHVIKDGKTELKKDLIAQIQTIIANAQVKAFRSVDNERMLMYWQIGKTIFEEEQQGQDRAEYGKFLL